MATANLNLTSFDPALKQLYDVHPRAEEVAYSKFPLLGIMPKYTKYEGRNTVFLLRVARPQGLGATFSTAQSNAISSAYEDFLLTVTKQYGVANIDGLTSEISMTNRGAFLKAITSEIDGTMKEVAREMSKALYRSRTGSLATVLAYTGSASTFTVAEGSAQLFEVNMEIVVSATDGGALRDSGASATITAINRGTQTLTSDSALDTQISGFAAGSYIYREGDQIAAGSGNLKPAGLASWLPATAPSSGDSFYGVDRSIDVERLAGNRTDQSGASSIEEALINGQSIAAVEGDGIDHIMMNNKNYRELVNALGSKVQYETAYVGMNSGEKSAQIGFKALCVQGDYGTIKVVPDRDCPVDIAYGLKLDTWKCMSVGNTPKIIQRDGLRIQRAATDDADQVRIVSYWNLGCISPVDNVRIAL